LVDMVYYRNFILYFTLIKFTNTALEPLLKWEAQLQLIEEVNHTELSTPVSVLWVKVMINKIEANDVS